MGLTPANRSLNVSQENAPQLYGGDIFLLGGSHLLQSSEEQKDAEKAGENKFSQASTTTGSEIPKSGSLNR